ncbi:MAG: glycosyltransferase [Desulfobacterales bacterium]|nr:glycosyltransferase [Desulfobacterales bacterium]
MDILIKPPARILRALLWHAWGRWIVLGRTAIKSFFKKYTSYPVIRVGGGTSGKALLCYVLEPHLSNYDNSQRSVHCNQWRTLAIAEIIKSLGFTVDVTDWRNWWSPHAKNYDLVIGLGRAYTSSCKKKAKGCTKIYLGTGAFFDQAIAGEELRIENLYQRKGKKLTRRYRTERDLGPLFSDAIFVIGSDWVVETYKQISQSPIYKLPNSVVTGVSNTTERKDYKVARRHFLWLASFGAVHRGLDLLLEVFSDLPEYHLWICGNVSRESDFVAIYDEELNHTPNIHHVGWVDVTSKKFEELTARCAYHVFPSASDGMPGAVINSMKAGLIPVLTIESGMETRGHSFLIQECSLDGIRRIIQQAADVDPKTLQEEAEAIVSFVENKYTKQSFAESFRGHLLSVLNR